MMGTDVLGRNGAIAAMVAVCGLAAVLAAAQPAGGSGAPAESRRALDGPPTALAFRNVTVEEMVPFIVAATGKVVMPQPDVLSRRVTVLNDSEIPRADALDLVFLALQQNGIAVVENDRIITLRDINEVTRQDVPVVGPNESVLGRRDLGTMVEKVFPLSHSSAKTMGETLKNSVPDYAKLTIDEESNQVAVLGSVALLQRLERLITSLDRPAAGALQTETFRLRYADAELIKTNIEELFSASASSSRSGSGNRQNQDPRAVFFGGQRGGGQQQEASSGGATSGEIRVTANTQQNSVTVAADPSVLAQIRTQIDSFWDLPLPDEAVVPRVYDLKNSDPVKVRDLLEGLFGRPTSGTGGGGAAQRAAGQATSAGSSQGVGRLAGQFSFQAIPEAGRLVVVAKSPDNLAVIDKIIEDLDQPQTVGLPAIVELKHANSEDLAEQINTLLAQDGTLASIRRSESGLSDSSSTASPFSSQAQDGATEEAQPAANQTGTIAFWWQRSRPPTDRRNASNLIGQIRIVPVWRQNALMVIAPPEYKSSIVDLIEQLDRPGRQVLISAIIAEVSREDATELGLRWSSQAISTTNPDNAIGVGLGATGAANNFASSLFDTSVLNATANLNLVLQALAQKTDVSILSEPKIFTSDNQEAEFFDGQDIPFPTDIQTTNVGATLQSVDYRAVGIQLRIRPRITVDGGVDLRVNLELSSILPGQTDSGAFIVDRRETTTQLILRNEQTVVISGILRKEQSEIVRKVPLLGDIPLLGALFRSKDASVTNTELLVFITPIVVNNEYGSAEVNDPYLRRLQNLRQQLEGDQKKDKDATSEPVQGANVPPVAPESTPEQ